MSISSRHKPVIGILGGGQLAGMLSSAARRLGCDVKVFERRGVDPIAPLIDCAVCGDWNDPDDLLSFAATVDAVTLENEFIHPAPLRALEEAGHILIPSSRTMSLIQDKLTQKRTLQAKGLPVPEFREVNSADELRSVSEQIGLPLVLKRRQMSYDGKGNALMTAQDDPHRTWSLLNGDEGGCFAEAFCRFDRELAAIVIRSPSGEMVHYPIVETVQRDHICHTVTAPAAVSQSVSAQAGRLAMQAVESVEGVGAFGVEMFLMKDETVYINELAPRVHNSGHYTIEACETSQFENHIRIVLGRPPGSTAMRRPAAVMINILGFVRADGTPRIAKERLDRDDVAVHIYGKRECRPGRKMGHVTALGDTADDAMRRAQDAADAIRFG